MIDLRKIEVTSISRNSTYEKCGEMFRQEYILKNRVRTEANHFIIGTICHKSLETYYTGQVDKPITALAQQWQDWLDERNLGELYLDLQLYRQDIAQLYRRARADYNKPDKIRTKDGRVSSKPEMTTPWKNAVAELQLDDRRIDIDMRALDALDGAYQDVSVSTCFAETHDLLEDYIDPSEIAAVEYIEFPISHRQYEENNYGVRELTDLWNPVQLPNTGIYLNGYADMIVRLTPEMGGGIGIVDHKTSSGDAPSVVQVAHHEQLLAYAWAWWSLTGEWPTHIGINHLRSRKAVFAEVDPTAAQNAIARLEALIVAQQAGVYLKKDPFGYNSPCLTMSGGLPTKMCPHLKSCHPLVFKNVTEAVGRSAVLADGFPD